MSESHPLFDELYATHMRCIDTELHHSRLHLSHTKVERASAALDELPDAIAVELATDLIQRLNKYREAMTAAVIDLIEIDASIWRILCAPNPPAELPND